MQEVSCQNQDMECKASYQNTSFTMCKSSLVSGRALHVSLCNVFLGSLADYQQLILLIKFSIFQLAIKVVIWWPGDWRYNFFAKVQVHFLYLAFSSVTFLFLLLWFILLDISTGEVGHHWFHGPHQFLPFEWLQGRCCGASLGILVLAVHPRVHWTICPACASCCPLML